MKKVNVYDIEIILQYFTNTKNYQENSKNFITSINNFEGLLLSILLTMFKFCFSKQEIN